MENIHVILIIFLLILMFKKSKSKENFSDKSDEQQLLDYASKLPRNDPDLALAFWENTDQNLGRPCQVRKEGGDIFSDCNETTYCDGTINNDDGYGLCHDRPSKDCSWANLSYGEDPCASEMFCNDSTGLCEYINQ